MKKYVALASVLLCLVALLTGCGEKKTVTCDGCGKAQTLDAGSRMDDSWIIYCKECYVRLFGEDGLIS